MKRKRRIYFNITRKNKEYFDSSNWCYSCYSYVAINSTDIYIGVYDILNKMKDISLSKIYCVDNTFDRCFIELRCNKKSFHSFCNSFINLFNEDIENIEF